MAVGTCVDCGKEKKLGNRTICEACRKRKQRQNKIDTIMNDEFKKPGMPFKGMPPTDGYVETQPQAQVVNVFSFEETPEQWLERRIKETGSTGMKSPNAKPGWQWIKTGTPPGSQPDIKVPIKWTLSDIDQAMSFRGQWGKREKS